MTPDLVVEIYTCPHCEYEMKIVAYRGQPSFDCGHITPEGDVHRLKWAGSYDYNHFPEYAGEKLGKEERT